MKPSWAAEVQSQELRRFVVRVDNQDGQVQGTGFFVAPGWVLSCAHVVKTANRVALVRTPGAAPIPATVEARSAPREGHSVFWPFPDLALIRLDVELDHPCVLLDTRLPVKGWCDAWGYSEREDGVAPTGSPASFQFEGVEGDEFLKLMAGQAAPGLSGAPLVCPGRRAVVGVMTMTRDKHQALGGWAAPMSALLTGGPGVPEDFLALGTEILRANRAAVLADRAAWHRVVPLAGSKDAFPPRWGTFQKTRRSDPADLLLAEYGVVPYLFRETDLETTIAWCDSAQALAVSVVSGRGGAGKTRFAMELCQQMTQPDHDWVCGMWDTTHDAAELTTLPLPRLIVVDYTESADLPALRSLLDRLDRHATDIAPARVLLLTRAGVTGARDPIPTLRDEARPSVKMILDASDVSTAASDQLDHDQRGVLYREAVAAFAAAWQVSPTPVAPDLSAPGYGLALEVLFEALDQTLTNGKDGARSGAPATSGSVVEPPVRSPSERVLVHEAKYWAADCPIDGARLRRDCVALATLAGAANTAEAHALISLLPTLRGERAITDRQDVTDWLAGLYDGAGLLNPLRPDRLGEALVGTMLRDQDDATSLLKAVFSLDSDDQVTQALEVLARLAINDHSIAGMLVCTFAAHHAELLERAETQTRGRPGQPGRLRLAAVLIRIHTGPIARSIAAVPPLDRIRALSVTYERLGKIAEQTGQPTEAHILYRQALTIRQGLAEAEPANTVYQRDLSISYERLADLAVAAGQGDEARRLFTQALTIAQGLAEAEPANTVYQRDLSISYNKLADLAVAAGQGDEARRLFTQALTIAQGLAEAEPANTVYQRDLSISYNKLADLAVAAGQGDEARRLFTQALTIAQGLAEAEPANTVYQRDLSISYNKLADLAVAAGQGDEARRLFTQALTIAQGLAEAEPANTVYQRDLSISYNKLADLAVAAGQGDEARRLFTQALTIRQGLAEAEPANTVYQRDLSISYNKLADLAVAAGQGDEARRLFTQALTIAQGLAEAEPANTVYQRDLSISYERLADLAVAAGQGDEARRLFTQALTIAQGLAEAEPANTVYQRDLSISYERLADLAVAAGQGDEARRLFTQALTIAQGLAEAEPANTVYQRDLSISYERLADLAVAAGQGDEARRLFTQALTIRQGLAEAEPANTVYQRDLSISYERLADLAVAAGQGDEARRLFTQALTIAQGLAEAEPANTVYQRDLSISYNKLADLAVAAGQGDEARRLFTQALTIRQGLAEAEPANTVYQRDLSISYERLGALVDEEPALAIEWFTKALALRRSLNAQEPERVDLAGELAYCLYLVASADPGKLEDIKRELIDLLSPFEISGTITTRAAAILRWAHE